jgi:hypothetical protein
MADPLRADLFGANIARCAGISVSGSSPVLTLCRRLVAAGHDPSLSLHVYRGATLALRVRSLGEGAKLTVSETRKHGPRFAEWVPFTGIDDFAQDGPETLSGSPRSALSGQGAVPLPASVTPLHAPPVSVSQPIPAGHVACAWCGEPFKPKRSTARYCSDGHRLAAHRERGARAA